jgi:hypothetical protein
MLHLTLDKYLTYLIKLGYETHRIIDIMTI